MKNVATSNTSAAPFRHRIDKGLLEKEINFVDRRLDRDDVAGMLEEDLRGYFPNPAATLDELLFTGGFTSYEGDRAKLLADLEKRGSMHFLVLSYLGKMQSALKSPHRNPDLSSIAFLNRLNYFAKTAERITGIDTKVTIAAENKAFDISIFCTGKDSSETMLEQTRKLMKDFGLDNVRVEPLEKFLGGDAYYEEFESELKKEKSDPENVKSENFRHVFDIFYTLYPVSAFEDGVKLYTSDTESAKISEWTTESVLRYSAFHEARAKRDFWGGNPQYVRSSVSSRPNVLVFQYGPGRVSPFNGVSTINGKEIGTEYFSDLVSDTSAGTAEFTRLTYENKPFCFDTGEQQ